jgi:hypothetical protein
MRLLDVDDPEAVVVADIREVAIERDVGVDRPVLVGDVQQGHVLDAARRLGQRGRRDGQFVRVVLTRIGHCRGR